MGRQAAGVGQPQPEGSSGLLAMATRFLNERLVTTKRFAPGAAAAHVAAGAPPAEAGVPAEPGEHERPREVLVRKECGDVARLYAEADRQLAEDAAALAREQDVVAARQEAVADRQQRLAAIPLPDEVDPPPVEVVRAARQALLDLHRELKQARSEATPVVSPGAAHPPAAVWAAVAGLLHLPPSQVTQLARLGLALTWPLAAAILLAGLLVMIAVLMAF